MRKSIYLFVLIISCFLFSGCLNFTLSRYKVGIPKLMEGVWQIGEDQYEIRKKGIFEANVRVLDDDDSQEPMVMTLHIIRGHFFVCITGWNQEQQDGAVFSIQIEELEKIYVNQIKLSKQDAKEFRQTASSQKEALFHSFLRNGKIKIDTSNKDNAVIRVKSFDD